MNIDSALSTFTSDITKHNFKMLWDRKKGEHFYVKDSKLCPVTTCWHRILEYFSRDELKQAINFVNSSLTTDKSIKRINDPAFYKTFFFEKMSRLRSNLFDRSILNKAAVDVLKKEVRKEETCIHGRSLGDKILQVKVAMRLGIDLKMVDGGSSGVYLGKSLYGIELLVFKPGEEGSFGDNNPKRLTRIIRKIQSACECLGWHLRRPLLAAHRECDAEVWAKQVDRFMGFYIVPNTVGHEFTSRAFYNPAKKADSQRKNGSCQEWVPEAIPASEQASSFRGLFYWPFHNKVEVDSEQFEHLAMLDFINGNQDRDTDNWMIKNNKITAFDNGLAFPHGHPTDWFSTRKQYMWGRLANANETFSQATKEKLSTKFKDGSKTLFDFEDLKSLDNAQRLAMVERILVLCFHVNNNRTIRELSQMKTKDDFAKFFSMDYENAFQSMGYGRLYQEYKDLKKDSESDKKLIKGKLNTDGSSV